MKTYPLEPLTEDEQEYAETYLKVFKSRYVEEQDKVQELRKKIKELEAKLADARRVLQ